MQQDDGGLFVSQESHLAGSQPPLDGDHASRKRGVSVEDDLMEGMAPAAAKFKRQRLEKGRHFASPSPEPESEPAKVLPKKKKEKIDVLALAARHREEEEARARAEREDLANLPDDIDLAEIRRLNIVEEMEVRASSRDARNREQDIADGRWNPKWNGVKNFKKFRARGEATGRQPLKTIVSLQEVKNKEFGIGDNYWLEEEGIDRKKSHSSFPTGQSTQGATPALGSSSRSNPIQVVVSGSEEEAGRAMDAESGRGTGPTGTSSTKITATPSQNQSTAASRETRMGRAKRPAVDSLSEQQAKRPRATLRAIEVADSDESEDELRFRFGKRR
jgi:hypothetical protein